MGDVRRMSSARESSDVQRWGEHSSYLHLSDDGKSVHIPARSLSPHQGATALSNWTIPPSGAHIVTLTAQGVGQEIGVIPVTVAAELGSRVLESPLFWNTSGVRN